MEKKFTINGQEVIVQDYQLKDGLVSFRLNGKNFRYELIDQKGQDMVLDHAGRFKAAVATPNKEGESMVIARGTEAVVAVAGKKSKRSQAAGSLVSPMPGKIFKLIKDVGSEVKKGEAILILEAMKMEHSIRADKDGKVKNIFFKPGELVQANVVLAEVE